MIKRTLLALLATFIPAPLLAFEPSASPAFFLKQSSHYCQGCHDGVIASDVSVMHPVGIDYQLAQLKSRGKLRNVSQLDAAIQLEDGRVGCLSCHRSDSRVQAKLITSNVGSALCFSCHNL